MATIDFNIVSWDYEPEFFTYDKVFDFQRDLRVQHMQRLTTKELTERGGAGKAIGFVNSCVGSWEGAPAYGDYDPLWNPYTLNDIGKNPLAHMIPNTLRAADGRCSFYRIKVRPTETSPSACFKYPYIFDRASSYHVYYCDDKGIFWKQNNTHSLCVPFSYYKKEEKYNSKSLMKATLKLNAAGEVIQIPEQDGHIRYNSYTVAGEFGEGMATWESGPCKISGGLIPYTCQTIGQSCFSVEGPTKFNTTCGDSSKLVNNEPPFREYTRGRGEWPPFSWSGKLGAMNFLDNTKNFPKDTFVMWPLSFFEIPWLYRYLIGEYTNYVFVGVFSLLSLVGCAYSIHKIEDDDD